MSASWGQSAQIYTFKSLQTRGNVPLAYGSPQKIIGNGFWFPWDIIVYTLQWHDKRRFSAVSCTCIVWTFKANRVKSQNCDKLEEEVPFESFWFRGIAGAPPATLSFLLKILCKRISSIPERADARFPGLVNNECLAETVWHRGNRTFNFKLSEERSKSRGMFIFMRIWIFVK